MKLGDAVFELVVADGLGAICIKRLHDRVQDVVGQGGIQALEAVPKVFVADSLSLTQFAEEVQHAQVVALENLTGDRKPSPMCMPVEPEEVQAHWPARLTMSMDAVHSANACRSASIAPRVTVGG